MRRIHRIAIDDQATKAPERTGLGVGEVAHYGWSITSNRDTAEWLAVFDDTLLAQSAVDRFRNSAYDLVIDGESYRSRLKPVLPADATLPTAPVQKRPTGRRRNLVT